MDMIHKRSPWVRRSRRVQAAVEWTALRAMADITLLALGHQLPVILPHKDERVGLNGGHDADG